jgi:hypothetical protein
MRQIVVLPSQPEIHKMDECRKYETCLKILNKAFSEFYNTSEHLTVDKVIAFFRGRVDFGQYSPKKARKFWHKYIQIM